MLYSSFCQLLVFLFTAAVFAIDGWAWDFELPQHQSYLENSAQTFRYTAPWQTLPPAPELPPAQYSGYADINGIKLWHAIFGADLDHTLSNGGIPVVFLHGGYAHSGFWAGQITHLANSVHTLITIDSRAQGRSTDNLSVPLTYDLMTKDVIALMDQLHIPRFAVVGWSDGACISFDLAMNHSSRVERIFAFSGTYNPTNMNATLGDSPVWQSYMQRVQYDYARLSKTPQSYSVLDSRLTKMWDDLPLWDSESFSKIPTIYDREDAPLIWFVSGDSEETITRSTPGTLHDWIWGSAFLLLPHVSHFA